MEVVLEFVLEVVLQVVLELLAQLAGRLAAEGLGRVLAHRSTRGFLVGVIGAFGGFFAGRWWGEHVAALGPGTPRALYVSLGLAGATLVIGLVQGIRRRHLPLLAESPSLRQELADSWRPWRWPAMRFLVFAAVNLALAAGMAVGNQPVPLR